ncbi:MAG: RNA polymerase sigma factor [Gemmatimonadetes bacterium]|nr:RNA polymerase sigma factor [Gemmatimonadota bacterium]
MNERIPDRELLEQARAGDHGAFRTLVQRYEPVVAATVIGMLGPGAEAEDVGQETFIGFYSALDRFREEASLKTYLTRIAINLSLNAVKRRRRFLARHVAGDSIQTNLPDPEPDPADRADSLETRERVRRAIERLPSKQRAVVTLRLIDGYSTRETAGVLGVPEGTVQSRLSRALKKLEAYLQPLVER